MRKGGCWIFLSHSSKDIEKVRIIRNEFEKLGQNPLAFHLKCLTTDTEEGRKEVDILIKREIQARDWFVYCDSPYTEKSKYVKMERSYIYEIGKDKIWVIDTMQDIEQIKEQVRRICTEIEVYISYVDEDSELANDLIKAFVGRDFSVWEKNDDKLANNSDKAIISASQNGFIIILLTTNFLNSEEHFKELANAVRSQGKVIPLVIGAVHLPSRYIDILKNIRIYNLPTKPKYDDITLVVELIENILKRKMNGPIDSGKADVLNIIKKIEEKLNYSLKYHPSKAVYISNEGAMGDYCEVYRFPCCGRCVETGDGEPTRFRADGCMDYNPESD
jgi:hypothetical protein